MNLAFFFKIGLGDGHVPCRGPEGLAVIKHRKAGDVDRHLARFGLVGDDHGNRAAFHAVAEACDTTTGHPRGGQGNGLGGCGHYSPSAVRGSNNRLTRPSNQSSDWVPVNL